MYILAILFFYIGVQLPGRQWGSGRPGKPVAGKFIDSRVVAFPVSCEKLMIAGSVSPSLTPTTGLTYYCLCTPTPICTKFGRTPWPVTSQNPSIWSLTDWTGTFCSELGCFIVLHLFLVCFYFCIVLSFPWDILSTYSPGRISFTCFMLLASQFFFQSSLLWISIFYWWHPFLSSISL